MRITNFIGCLLLLSITLPSLYGQINPSLSPTPPMGWNSWNWFGKQDINERIVYEVIDAMVEHGLRDAGYNYVVIDGGWRDVKLSPEGKLLPHPEKFPNGIKPLADYAHSKGMKFGLHTVPGTHDCGRDEVGGFNREEIHVQQFVDWGIDFVKLDKCRHVNDPCVPCEKNREGWSEPTILSVYTKWSTLLNTSGRDILFSISAYDFRGWNPGVCNMSRTTYDIQSKRQAEGAIFNSEKRINRSFLSVLACAELNDKYARFAGDGYWNDPDMLVTGEQGLTVTEQVTHFALWSVISAPLILGNDPRQMSAEEKKLLLNKEIIEVNQDPGEQGILIDTKNEIQIWKKDLTNGKTAILLININPVKNQNLTIDLNEYGLIKGSNIRDIINGKEIKLKKGRLFETMLLPHECAFLLFNSNN